MKMHNINIRVTNQKVTALLLVEAPPKGKVELQDTPVKRAPEAFTMTVFPRMPDNAKRDVLVRRSGRKDEQLSIIVTGDTFRVVCRPL